MFPNSFERQLVLNRFTTSCITEAGYPTARVPQLQIGPKRKKAIKFVQKVHGVHDGIPHVCLHIPTGVCMRSEIAKSRYNLHNVIVVVHEIKRLICRPHLGRTADNHRNAISRVTKAYRDTLAKLNLWGIGVMTVDSFQGGQIHCVFFDIVLASCCLGGWGLVKEQPRLNVGFSRPQDQFYFIGDINALRRSPHH